MYRYSTFLFLSNIGGGGGIGECIGMEMTKLNVKIVLWDINEGTFSCQDCYF